jgi:hypothetical protein
VSLELVSITAEVLFFKVVSTFAAGSPMMTGFNVLEGSAPYVDVTTLTPLPPSGRTAYQKAVDINLKL